MPPTQTLARPEWRHMGAHAHASYLVLKNPDLVRSLGDPWRDIRRRRRRRCCLAGLSSCHLVCLMRLALRLDIQLGEEGGGGCQWRRGLMGGGGGSGQVVHLQGPHLQGSTKKVNPGLR